MSTARRRRHRPPHVRRLGAHRRHPTFPRIGCRRASGRTASRSPTCRRATRSFSRSRSRGPRCSARATSSSASTRSTTAATPTAGPSTFAPTSRWRTSPRGRASRVTRRSTSARRCIDLTKRQIIELGQRLGVDYALTTSCYDPSPDGAACGHCDACQLRLRGFREAGTSDPARYAPEADDSRSVSRAMTYTVKEIFYTLQGEGANAGRPAVFCRFSGCNLWTGREDDRASCRLHVLRHRFRRRRSRRRQVRDRRCTRRRRSSRWPWRGRAPAHAARRVHRRRAAAAARRRRRVARSTQRGFEIAVETNGTRPAPAGLDWVCVSPKATAPRRADARQ